MNQIKKDIKLDKEVATKIMGWDNNRTNLEEFEEDENSNSFPEYSSDMNYAMFVAEKVKLFNNFVLHKKKDVTSQDWVWQISEINNEGKIQKFLIAETPEKAICLAALKSTNWH